MRKFMLSAIIAVFAISAAFAQSGEDALKNAEKSYKSYQSGNDLVDLQAAVDAVALAMDDSQVQSDVEAYLTAGDIYSAAIQRYVVDSQMSGGEQIDPVVGRAAVKAAQAYMKAYEMADRNRDQKTALKGLQNLQANISNEGIMAIQGNNYEDSYEAFNTSINVHNFLTEQGEDSAFEGDETKLNDERYYAALSAVLNEQYDKSEPLFLALYEAGYNDAGLYDGLYKTYSGLGDMEKAGQYLSEGREKFPEETQLLFTEINYYLAQDRLDELTGKLEEAIAAEPENVSLYATLGQVYERLYMSQREENPEQAQEYFEMAKSNYERGLEKQPENASLIYSLGALYFNNAAKMTEQLVELGNDLSKDGQAKYEAMNKEINGEFEKAFPYFKKAEQTDPNNLNTLIALKEIFARQDDYDASNEMKNRIERVQAGETIEDSYFK